MAMTERPRLDPQTRRWLKLEVSRRRKEKELHVGRPVLHRYSKRSASALDPSAGVTTSSVPTDSDFPTATANTFEGSPSSPSARPIGSGSCGDDLHGSVAVA